jgi:hypothetical protein
VPFVHQPNSKPCCHFVSRPQDTFRLLHFSHALVSCRRPLKGPLNMFRSTLRGAPSILTRGIGIVAPYPHGIIICIGKRVDSGNCEPEFDAHSLLVFQTTFKMNLDWPLSNSTRYAVAVSTILQQRFLGNIRAPSIRPSILSTGTWHGGQCRKTNVTVGDDPCPKSIAIAQRCYIGA